MMKRKHIIPVIGLILLYFIYFVALLYQNDLIGDIISPLLTLIVFVPVCIGFFWKEKHKLLKLSGLFFALCMLTWAVCDIMWGVSTLFLHADPESNPLINNGYSLTNLFLFISLMISGYFQIRSWNKMQIILDTMMVSVSIMIIIWVFIFDQDTSRAEVLLTDTVGTLSLIMDVAIYAWTNIWFFSVRQRKDPLFLNYAAIGGIVFVVTDIIYYYYYYYLTYKPNSLIDGGYVIAFTLFGVSGWIRMKGYDRRNENKRISDEAKSGRFKKELLFLIVPMLVIIFKGTQAPSLLILVTAMMFYFIFTKYTQSNIYRDEMLKREKEYVLELEQRIEERTAEILKIMNTDVITGLKSRRYFEEYLDKLIHSIRGNDRIYLMYIDQNKYKSLKAIYGKYVAEKILQEVGKRIDQIMIENGGQAASYGEDVFVAVLKSPGEYVEALSLAEKIIHHCSDSYHIENHALNVTLNIGISAYPKDANNMEELIRNADTAMLQARKKGFNSIRIYDQQIGAYINQKDRIEMKLKKVSFDEEFSLQYQPQVSCKDGSIQGAEALLRWYTKSGDYVPPLEFIPITEETGMVIPLGYWVMDQAAKQLAGWRSELNTNIRMAINVSIKQLLEEHFAVNLKQKLEYHQIPPESFEIEITESIQLENNTLIQNTLKQVRDMGITVAVDDFGTGYSSLSYLKQLPVNRIKIAKELIDHIESDIYSKSIVQMIISIAKVNNIKVIAEGVETKEQWECLQGLQCDEIQGYLFSKPLIPSELESKWLSRK